MIYFIEAVGVGLLKIGFTDRSPEVRLRELQTGCPHKLRLVGFCDGPATSEKLHHERWQHLRTTGEWFRVDDQLRGYLWWVEFGKPYTDDSVSAAKGDFDHISRMVVEMYGDVMAVCEREWWTSDQISRLWNAVESSGRLSRTPNFDPVSGRYADCRM